MEIYPQYFNSNAKHWKACHERALRYNFPLLCSVLSWLLAVQARAVRQWISGKITMMTSVPDPQAVNSTLLTNRFQFPHLTTQTSSSIMSSGLHLKSKKTLTLIQGKGQGNWKRQRCTMNLTSYEVVIDSLCGQQSTQSWLRDWKCWSQCSAEKREYIV